MSTLEKEDAILFGIHPFSETSCVVSWFSKHHGRLHTMVKGAFRPKGGWVGRLDLFFTEEIVYYHRGAHALHALKECDPIATRNALRGNWRATAAASYLVRLVSDFCPIEAPHPDLFSILNTALDRLAATCSPGLVLAQTELQILTAVGLAPQFNSCVQCLRSIRAQATPGNKSALRPPAPSFAFFPERGGLLCPDCLASHETSASATNALSMEMVAMLRSWQQPHPPGDRARASLSKEALRLIGLFLAGRVDHAVAARSAAIAILAHNPKSCV